MSTITLYKDKLNGVGGLIDNIIKSSNNLDTQLGTLKSTLQGVSSSTYNLQDTVNSISSSSKTEKEKVRDLKKLNKQVTEFITTTVKRDSSVRDEINKSKKDFYSKYSYLKPDCEKNAIEKIVEHVEKAAEWCEKHWKLIATAVIVIVAVVLLFTGVGSGLGAAIIAGACWGAIFGAVIGGVSGGLNSMKNGGTFLDGFENGSFNGAVGGMFGGAITGGLSFTVGPGMSLAGSILKNAGIGAVSSGSSNMVVTTIDYLIEHRNLVGAMDNIAVSGIAGVFSGAIAGGIIGALAFSKSGTNSAKTYTEGGSYSNLGNMSFEDGKQYSSWSKLREEGLSLEQVEKIKGTPKGQKPLPETYLSEGYINNHLNLFKKSGAVKIMPSEPSGTIGGKGGTFVMSGDELSEIIRNADGDVAKIESVLGLDKGYLGSNPVIVTIQDTSSLRLPSGNELGAWPEYWEPGGYTSGGIKEAVINPAKEGTYTYKHLFE